MEPDEVAEGTAEDRGGAGGRDFWDRSVVGWHAVWLGVLVVVAAVVATMPGPGVGLAAVAVLVLAYLLVGARLVGEQLGRGAGPYLLVVVAGLLVVQWSAGSAIVTPALFALFPQLWVLLPPRGAVVATVAVPLTLGLARGAQLGWAPDAVRAALVESVAQLAVALLLGLWITGVVRESTGRAELVAQLSAAREDLAAAERARGVLAERERMAREIHDTLAQGFTSTVALAQAAQAALEQVPPVTEEGRDETTRRSVGVAGERLALIEATARANLAEARAIVEALRPADLDVGGGGSPLGDALDRLARRTGAETGLAVDVVGARDLPPLPPQAEVVLLRAAQEGLSNVRRHAAATAVRITVELAGGVVLMRVADDGGGPRGGGDGYGLSAMASRLREVDGRVTLHPGDAGGTVLRVEVPLTGGSTT